MNNPLLPEIESLLADPASVAVIATTDENGTPHATPSPFLQLAGDGRLIHLELWETSATGRNLLRGLWFDRPAAVTLMAGDGRTFVLQVKPVKVLITGPLFSRYYREVRARLGDVDLAGVWYLEPLGGSDETHAVRLAEEEQRSPFYVHLDRLTVDRVQ